MTTEAVKSIPIEDIKKYRDANIPIRPVKANGAPDIYNIFYDGEVNKILGNLSGDLRKWVYKSDNVQPLKLLAVQPLSPKYFWTDVRIVQQNWINIECQTGFNASLASIVLGIDVDDEKPKIIVRRLITEYGLDGKTVIQSTPHGGLHLLLKVPCSGKIEEIELWRKRALRLELCKTGCKIEIKTTTMGITLSPSKHRKDGKSYTHEGVIDIAEVQPEFYHRLVDELKSNGCISETPEEYYAKVIEQEKADFEATDSKIRRHELTKSEIIDGINIILGRDGKVVGSAYEVGYRDNIVISLGGHFYYHYISLESAKTFVQKLGESAGDSNEDIQSSLQKIDRTWALGNNKERIRGKSGLIRAFARLKDGDLAFGQERIALLEQALTFSEAKNQSKESTIDPNLDLKEKLEAELILKIPDRDYAEFLIETIKRTVKQEDSLVRQIVYTVLSKDTRNPLNLAVLAPTSEGKTYAVLQVLQFFLGPDIKKIGSMSPRVIIRQNGILVDADNQPIADKIKDLKKRIRKAKASNKTKSKGKKTSSSEEKEDLEDLEEQLAQLYDDAKVLIDLQGKLWVFLEPPEKETWNILKTLLSHDSFEIEHPYVYELPGKGFSVKKVVTRGWPACIFCSAKNESDWPVWAEIQSRFLVASPNMVKQKYLEGNILTAQKMGLPSLLQQQIIVSNNRLDLARKCASYLIEQMSQFNNHDTNPVWVPFAPILGKVLPAEKGTDNRIAKRIFSFLSIITQCRAHLRGRLEYGNERLAIADMDEDFHEVLHITQNLSGVPPFKLRVFKEVLLSLYKSKQEPDKIEDGKFSRHEKVIAVTTRQLCDYYKGTIGRTITTDAMKKIYLDEFINNGLIDAIRSELDNRQNIYFPLVDTSVADNDDNESKITKLSITTRLDNILQHSKIMVSKNYNRTAENWLELQIFSLLKYRTEIGHFALFDKDGEQICPCKFIYEYQKRLDLTRYFSKPIFYNSDEKIFGDITKLSIVVEKEYKKLSSEVKFDNLVISEPVIAETPTTFKHSLGYMFVYLDVTNKPSATYDHRSIPSCKSIDPLHGCQSFSIQNLVRYRPDTKFYDVRMDWSLIDGPLEL
jgi:hypothetical protein